MSTGICSDAVENFIRRGHAGFLSEHREQVLLRRLTGGRGATTEGGVSLGGDIFYLDAGHGSRVAPLGQSVGRTTAANWSATGVNSGMTKSRRSQLAPSTTRVWPVTKEA